jgi:hypothetical protein
MAYTSINDPEAYFQVKLYSGTGSSNAQTFDGDTDMQPDLVVIKSRNHAYGHHWTDAVRGAGKDLYSELTDDEYPNANSLASFDSDGFTVGSDNGVNNGSSKTYVAWCWKESATAGFDIVSYTGNAVDGRTISHSLSAVPDMYIIKNRSAAEPWMVYHGSLGNTKALYLNTTMAAATSNSYTNDTSPTSSVFSVSDWEGNNGDGNSIIAYLFTSKQGFSKFSSYTGNGSTNGPFIYTGFRPAMIIIKTTSGADRWVISDNKRDVDNVVVGELNPNDSAVENTSGTPFDFLSNGFKLRRTGDVFNTDGDVYVYMAFAEAPFVNSKGVPCNAR